MRVGEYGVPVFLNSGIDLSGYTNLSVLFERSDGTQLTVTLPYVSLGIVDITTNIGDFLANQYVAYTFVVGDLNVAGTWHATLTYDDAARHLISNRASFRVHK